jgi:hypothetical protein
MHDSHDTTTNQLLMAACLDPGRTHRFSAPTQPPASARQGSPATVRPCNVSAVGQNVGAVATGGRPLEDTGVEERE